jgi:hypothetical protein
MTRMHETLVARIAAILMTATLVGAGAVATATPGRADATSIARCEVSYVDAATCGFTHLTLAGPASVTVPLGKRWDTAVVNIDESDTSVEVPFSLTLDGPSESLDPSSGAVGVYSYVIGTKWDQSDDSSSSSVELVAKHASSPVNWQTDTRIDALPAVSVSEAGRVGLLVNAGTQPGTYRIGVTVSEFYTVANASGTTVAPNANSVLVKTETVTLTLTILANPANGRMTTDVRYSGKKGKRSRITAELSIPGYQDRAKVKLYYRASGARTYKLVAAGTARTDGDWAWPTLRTKKGAVRRAGSFFVTVGAVPYSAGWQTATKTIR